MAGRAAGTDPASRSPPRARGQTPTHVRRSPPGRVVRPDSERLAGSPQCLQRLDDEPPFERREHGVRPVESLSRSETRTQGSGRLGPPPRRARRAAPPRSRRRRGLASRYARPSPGRAQPPRCGTEPSPASAGRAAPDPGRRAGAGGRAGGSNGPGRFRASVMRCRNGRSNGRSSPIAGKRTRTSRPAARTEAARSAQRPGSARVIESNDRGWERAAARTTPHSR